MNTQQARERVAETFPQPFNKTKFLEFSRNLLNKFDESKAAQWNATYVKDAFKPHVSRFERLLVMANRRVAAIFHVQQPTKIDMRPCQQLRFASNLQGLLEKRFGYFCLFRFGGG